jgi:hypothetical protein
VDLTDKQKGVIRGVIPAAALSVVGLCGASLWLPVSTLPANEPGARIAWAVQWSLLPILTLMIAVARVGNHRFSTPEDIDGSGLTNGTQQIRVLRSVLQNTLEQTVLAVVAYVIWAVVIRESGYGQSQLPRCFSSPDEYFLAAVIRAARLGGHWDLV